MAPTFQAAGVSGGSTGASANIGWPVHAANDIALCVIETSGDSATLTPPTGWAAIPNTPVVDVATAAGSKLHLWWKRAASSAETFVATGATGDHISGRIVTFRGCVTTGNPWNVTTTGIKTTASTTATVPSLTTTLDDTLIVMIVGRPDDSASTGHFGVPVNANLTNIAERSETGTVNGNGGGYVVSTGVCALPGATGTSTLTKTVSTTDTYIVVALKAPTELITTLGTFNLTGVNVDLTYTPTSGGLELICQTGPFTWSGVSNILAQQLLLNNTFESFAFNGLSIGQQLSLVLNGNNGSFVLNGTFFDSLFSRTLNLTAGTFLLNGISLNSAFTYAIIGSNRSFLIGFNPADIAKNFQLISSTGTYTLTGVSSDAVKNYSIVALPQSYLVGTTGIDYFSTRRLEASTAGFIMTLQSNGDFFWYQTTQTIPIIKPRLTNRNQWILGRATHMGRRGL